MRLLGRHRRGRPPEYSKQRLFIIEEPDYVTWFTHQPRQSFSTRT